MVKQVQGPDLSKSPYDLDTYVGRAMHFFRLTNPLNLLASNSSLEEAKKHVMEYKQKGNYLPEGQANLDKLWRDKYLMDSAYHPDTGERMLLVGRMSAQMPMNTLITGAMITFYKTTAAVVFWQWFNQTFNAIVNYSNRSGDTPITPTQLTISYCSAVGGALGTALILNAKAKKMKNPIFQRLVPFGAVVAANCINIPMMRMNEITNGTPVFDPCDNEKMGLSKTAAITGISLVCLSRCFMAVPGMVLIPVIMNSLIRRGTFCRRDHLIMPAQLAMLAACVGIATPLGCAIFKQTASIGIDSVEPEIAKNAKAKGLKELVYNKGL